MTSGYIRFFNALPQNAALAISFDDKVYIKNWEYKDFTNYTQKTSGQHLIRISDLSDDLIYEKRINVKANASYTYVLAYAPNTQKKIYLFSLEDTKKNYHPQHGYLRMGHFSAEYPKLNLLHKEDNLLFKDTPYGHLTHYFPLKPLTYSFFTTCQATSHSSVQLKKHLVKVGRQYTLYLVGAGTKDYPFECITTIDGPSFLKCLQKSNPQVS